jgi:nucleoside-diphosphate-sugar epimerase
MTKRALVLGATGAMATYLIPKLLSEGYVVDGVCLDAPSSDGECFTLINHDAKDKIFLSELLENGYDTIVDFMLYPTVEEFSEYADLFLPKTRRYIYLSTYRVYAWEYPITESTLRLIDAKLPEGFVYDREYSIYKAAEEDWLRSSKYKNYSIIRPAITFSKRRFQLTTLEADVLIHRMKLGKTVLLPEGTRGVQATMSWAGDVARMIYAVITSDEAEGETYTVSTSEHHTWEEVAEMYRRIGGLSYAFIPDEDYLNVVANGGIAARQQLNYDRMLNRVIDNSKILALMNDTQDELMPLEEGLRMEYEHLDPSTLPFKRSVSDAMDEYIASHGITPIA